MAPQPLQRGQPLYSGARAAAPAAYPRHGRRSGRLSARLDEIVGVALAVARPWPSLEVLTSAASFVNVFASHSKNGFLKSKDRLISSRISKGCLKWSTYPRNSKNQFHRVPLHRCSVVGVANIFSVSIPSPLTSPLFPGRLRGGEARNGTSFDELCVAVT